MAWRWSVCGTAEVVWKPRFLWQWPSAHLHFLISCFSFSSWQNPIDCLGFRSGEFAGQSFNQLLGLLAVWAGAKSCWKMKSASLKSWSAEGSMKCSKISWQTGAVMLVFSTLPLDSRTLVYNLNTKLVEKRTLDHWATIQFFFSLAQVRRFWWHL